jgi:hypothetical protein
MKPESNVCRLPLATFMLVFSVKMEGVRPFEISMEFYRNKRRYIPEDRTLHSPVNLKSIIPTYRWEPVLAIFFIQSLR